MTALLKSRQLQTAKVREAPLLAPQPQAETICPPDESLGLRLELEGSLKVIEDLREDIQRLEARAAQAFVEGEAVGRAAGRREAEDLEAERLARVTDGVALAARRFDGQLDELERLAGLLAREGLEKILGDKSLHAGLLTETLSRQFEALKARTILDVEVSGADFKTKTALASFRKKLGRPDIVVKVSSSLAPGECHINLQLGGVEAGIGEQWGRLKDVLNGIAGEPS